MPELPEVETVRRTMEPHVTGRTIKGVLVSNPVVVKTPEAQTFANNLIGLKIVEADRKGKYLIFKLEKADQTNMYLLVHLGMSGQLLYANKIEPRQKHMHVLIRLDDDNEMRYVDPRRFGQLRLYTKNEYDNYHGLKNMGRDVLKDFGINYHWEDFKRDLLTNEHKNGEIKPVLMRQNLIAGVGNYIASEVCFRAKVSPYCTPEALTDEEFRNIFEETRNVILESLDNQGMSLKDYVDAEGKKGTFQFMLTVYNRKGQNCVRENCDGKIEKDPNQAARATYYCPKCQK